MSLAIYPGSFDPVTNGHLDIVNRACKIFDQVLVAVYATPSKRLLFNTEERVELFNLAVQNITKVKVITYTGMTVELAREYKAEALIRGLRSGSDFDNEFEMALMNKKLAPEVESVFLLSSLEHQFLSSTLLKEVAQLGGDIETMVPQHVVAALSEKFEIAQT